MAADLDTAKAAVETPPADPSKTDTQPEQPTANGTVDSTPRKPRPRRPNYNAIHAKPLPVDVYPLPAFVPHNPLSIVRIVISLLSHALFPPKSDNAVHQAYFSTETQSVHVTDAASIRALWEQGFWGKGSLSRSEPQWLVGEKKRQGIDASKTSAEVTQSRREERRQFKLERARAQREAIEQQLRQEGKLDADGNVEELVDDGQVSESPLGTIYDPENGNVIAVSGDDIASEISKTLSSEAPAWGENFEPAELVDQEHLQLTPEEAFFLTYTLGALSIISDGNKDPQMKQDHALPAWYLLRLYAAHASSPIDTSQITHLQMAYAMHHREAPTYTSYEEISSIPQIQPDNPFILRYVVYHHFRSLGWVVRPGIKFAVDYLLYMRGPAFHHAEFAIMIIPSYSDAYWSEAPESWTNSSERRGEVAKKDWWWLHRVNRVQSAVFKTLVLVYVEVPRHWDEGFRDEGWKVDVGSVLKQYSVREVVLKRWSPNRNRD